MEITNIIFSFVKIIAVIVYLYGLFWVLGLSVKSVNVGGRQLNFSVLIKGVGLKVYLAGGALHHFQAFCQSGGAVVQDLDPVSGNKGAISDFFKKPPESRGPQRGEVVRPAEFHEKSRHASPFPAQAVFSPYGNPVGAGVRQPVHQKGPLVSALSGNQGVPGVRPEIHVLKG